MESPNSTKEMMVGKESNKPNNIHTSNDTNRTKDIDNRKNNQLNNHHNKNYKIKGYEVQINIQLKEVLSVADAKYNEDCSCGISPYIEVAFADHRKKLFKNEKNLKLQMFEYVIVQIESGLELCTVISCGKEADEKHKTTDKIEFSVIRRALLNDIKKMQKNHLEEIKVVEKAKTMVEKHKLDMKVTAAEWQFDRHRLTVFFTAPQRIDFRELVKDLARTFKTRIELRQISTREEARRIGGMGPCGLNICCTSFSSDNCHVTLDHARHQLLANNVSKLSGYCGRLKCCLLYEHDIYVEILKKYPPIYSTIALKEGKAVLNKIDIFKETATLFFPNLGVYRSVTGEQLKTYVADGLVTPSKFEDFKHRNDIPEKEIEELEAEY